MMVENKYMKPQENFGHTLGVAAAPVGETHVADFDSVTPFTLTSGNNDFGAWQLIKGSEDIFDSLKTRYQLRFINLTYVDDEAVTSIDFAFGDTVGEAEEKKAVIRKTFVPINGQLGPVQILSISCCITKLWARVKVKDRDASQIKFFYDIIEI